MPYALLLELEDHREAERTRLRIGETAAIRAARRRLAKVGNRRRTAGPGVRSAPHDVVRPQLFLTIEDVEDLRAETRLSGVVEPPRALERGVEVPLHAFDRIGTALVIEERGGV